MYFKRLEIFGFKSFADKTVLNFEPGITAIVGPNGCGKSNIFDSIRWVLGEQSVKELRGASMEDVIFNGTEKKTSLGFAEVSVTFSNESRRFPLEQDEVTITRRLFRSGESEYLLNKTTSRLKDIQELLMGTGIGAEAYSLVQQGRVDLVVSAKPEDRRILLDEAAGITKYKSKKKEAMNKLKDTDNNLLRINDIVVEVKRQIGSIERQASKARRYKEEYEKLKDLELKLAYLRIQEFAQKREQILAQLGSYEDKVARLNVQIEEQSSVLTNEINYLDELEQKINDTHSEEIKLDGQIDLNKRQIEFNRERIENINQNAERNTIQKEQLIERCRLQQAKIEELKTTLASLQEKIVQSAELVVLKRDELASLERLIKDSKEKIKDDEEKILVLTAQQVQIRNEVTNIMKETQGALARKRRLEMENAKVSTEKQEVDQKLQNVAYQMQALSGSLEELRSAKYNNDQNLVRLQAELTELENQIEYFEKKKIFSISQKEFIEKLQSQYQDIPDPIIEGRLFTQTPPLEHHSGILGKVKSVVPLTPERIEQLMGNMPAVEGQNQSLYEIICEAKFIELDPQQISQRIEEFSLKIGELQVQRDSLLQNIQEQNTIIQNIEQELLGKEKSLSVIEAQQGDILKEEKKIIGELELVDVELNEVTTSLVDLKKKEDEFNYKLDTLNQDISWCQLDIKEKQDAISQKSQERELASISVAQLEAEKSSDEEKLRGQEDNLKMFTEAIDVWLEEIKKIDDETIEQQSKAQQFEAQIEELIVKLEEIETSKASLRSIMSDFETQKDDIAQRINSLRANMASIEDELESINQEKHRFDLEAQQLSFDEKAFKDRLQQAYKINYDEWIISIQQPQVNENVVAPVVSTESESPVVEASESGAQPSIEQSVQTPVAPTPVVFSVEGINPEQLLPEIELLRKRCDAFGSVNLVAIEEYEELKQRFEFLTKQQCDLIEAKSQLMNTINKINRSTRQMFLDTFTKVSEEFRIYFRMLFGGGDAQLVLLDQENVLESGIEIVARPPGKKLQSISLLSGGEKSLTAIALIFGIFKVNPSPFCVLDEIDAALDEANVGRFSFLLKDFSKISQFIVITHNKKTISSADVMYGITMPETGVSRIVSVKLSEDKKEKLPQEVEAAA